MSNNFLDLNGLAHYKEKSDQALSASLALKQDIPTNFNLDLDNYLCIRIDQDKSFLRLDVTLDGHGIGQIIVMTTSNPSNAALIATSGIKNNVVFGKFTYTTGDGYTYLGIYHNSGADHILSIDVATLSGKTPTIRSLFVDTVMEQTPTPFTAVSYLADNADLELKQDTLVSGQNIKTVNGTTLLGSGNIDIDSVFAVNDGTTYAQLREAINNGLFPVRYINDYGDWYPLVFDGGTEGEPFVFAGLDENGNSIRVLRFIWDDNLEYVWDSFSIPLTSSVRFDTSQTLNDLQKARARSNIGAAGTADLRPITLQGMIGESLFLLLPDNGDPLPLRIDISAHTTEDDANYPKVGSLLITIAMGGSAEVEAYYYGTDISDLLGGVAVYEDDENYYLVVRPTNTLTEPRYFSVTPLNGGDIEAQMLEIDEQTLVDTITPTELGAGGGSDVFWATYNSTTLQEIGDAYNAGKLVVCMKGGTDYILSSYVANGFAYFGNVANKTSRYLLRSTSGWSEGIRTLEDTSDKVSTLSGNETNTTKYPNTKAVADALGKWGVISQVQTWTNSAPYTYTMQDKVEGIIPQFFIDLVTCGLNSLVNFNSATGYFELNELTDISYQEMLVIYDKAIRTQDLTCLFKYGAITAGTPRTTLPRLGGANGDDGGGTLNLAGTFLNSSVETIAFLQYPNATTYTMRVKSLGNTFKGAKYLKKIINVMRFDLDTPYMVTAFAGCTSLEYAHIKTKNQSLVFSDSPYFALESVVWIVKNAVNTSAITITLHATAYARCQADTTEYTYGGQTYTGIIAYANARNITIASA